MEKQYFNNVRNMADLARQYRRLSKIHHPDTGGAKENFQEVNKQRDKLARELMKTNGMSDHDITTTLQDENWMDNLAEFSDEISSSGNVIQALGKKGSGIAEDLLAGDPENYSTNGSLDFSKVFNHVFGMVTGKKNIDEKKDEDPPKQITK